MTVNENDLIQLAETALRKRMQWQAEDRHAPEYNDTVAVAALNIDTLLAYVAVTEMRRISECLETLLEALSPDAQRDTQADGAALIAERLGSIDQKLNHVADAASLYVYSKS